MHLAQEHAATGSLTEQQGEGTRVVAAEKMTKMVLVMPDWIKWLINSHICNMLRVRGTSLHVRGTSLRVKGTRFWLASRQGNKNATLMFGQYWFLRLSLRHWVKIGSRKNRRW